MARDRIRAAGEHVVAWGVRTGRFAAERADFWAARYAADPEGTTHTIESLAPVLADPGYQRLIAAAAPLHADESATDDSVDAEFAHLFPPTAEQFDAVQAARAARVAAMSDEQLMDELFGPGA